MTIKRKVTFHEDIDVNPPRCDVQGQTAKKVRRCSSNSVDARERERERERDQATPSLWYSSLELRALRKNAMLAMEQHEDEYQNQQLCDHLLHRSYQAHQSGSSSHSKTNDNENGGDNSISDPPYDEKAAQTILNIWTTGDLRFGVSSSSDDDCRRGMENLYSSRLAGIRRTHRKRVTIGVILAQQRYQCQGDLHDRIAQVSRYCSAGSRDFAELMGNADAMAAAHIHLINIQDQQQKQRPMMMMSSSDNDVVSSSPTPSSLDPAESNNQGVAITNQEFNSVVPPPPDSQLVHVA